MSITESIVPPRQPVDGHEVTHQPSPGTLPRPLFLLQNQGAVHTVPVTSRQPVIQSGVAPDVTAGKLAQITD